MELVAILAPKRIHLKDGTEVVLRSGQESDALALLGAAQTTFLDGEGMVVEPDEFNMTEDQEKAWISALNENPRELLLLAEVQGRIIGNIDFHIAKRRRLAHSGYFGISIHPDWRNRGIGNVLLESLLAWARAVPEIEKIKLKVRADNPRAIALYRKHGFVQCGCSKDEIKLRDGVYVDDIEMERFVRS
jgi:RimJ/RimL family protein N-acetyltransferase